MPVVFKIKRIDDRTLFALLKKAQKEGEHALKSVRESGELQGQEHQIQLSFSSNLPWQISEADLSSASAGEFVISNAAITFHAKNKTKPHNQQNVTFRFSRGGEGGLMDSFELNNGGQGSVMNGEGEQNVQKAIHKALSSLLQPVAPEDGGLVPTLSNLAESFNTTYQRISEELSASVLAVSQERSKQITDFKEERRLLQEEISKERSAMQEAAKQEIAAEKQEIEDERKEIEEERNKLEISSHKDARRKQFNDLQENLRKSLSQPVADRGLRLNRLLVFVALMIAGSVAGFLASDSIKVAASVPLDAPTTAYVVPTIRSFLLALTALAAFFGAAAWLRYFYIRDMQAQEEIRRFRNDMARASWVMDAALEIRKEHDEEIPAEWISGVTEGLFTAQRKDSLDEGALALAALMGLSASASIGPNGTSIELGKRGGKTIASAMKDKK